MGRIALIGENSVEYVNALIDIWNNGDCAVLIDFRIPFMTAVQMMYEAGVKTCYAEKKIYDKWIDSFPETIVFNYYDKTSASVGLLPEFIYNKFTSSYNQAEAVVIYSSGTTGKSKGIILSHYAINTNADAIIDYLHLEETDCMYMIKTISHSSSITGELLVSLKTHTKLLISPIIVPPRYTLSNIEKFGITKICINPTLLKLYIDECQRCEYNLTSLKEIYVHGAKANKNLCILAKKCFENAKVYFEYGLSEAGPRVASQKISAQKVDSVGKAIKGVEIIVVNESGDKVRREHRGIIHIKTPSRYLGYISGNEKYKSLYRDWLNTGDVGFIDKNGELHVINRIDDIIILDSHKIYPNDIEKVIAENTDIEECVVLKVEIKDAELLCCLYRGDSELSKGLIPKLKTSLMSYEIPKVIISCDEFPRTANGKISRVKIVDMIKQYIDNKHKI